MLELCITKQSLLMANVLHGGLPRIFNCEPTTKTKHMHHWKLDEGYIGPGLLLEDALWDELDTKTFCIIWTSTDGYFRKHRGTPVVFRMSSKPPKGDGEARGRLSKNIFNL